MTDDRAALELLETWRLVSYLGIACAMVWLVAVIYSLSPLSPVSDPVSVSVSARPW